MKFTFVTAEEFKNVSNFSRNGYISIEDIDTFLYMMLKNAATRLKMEFDILQKMVEDNNPDFFEFKSNYFKKNRYISSSSNEFLRWCTLLKIPMSEEQIKLKRSNNMTTTAKILPEPTHADCMQLFNTLSIEEKIKFIKEFEKVQIALTPAEISKLFN